VSVKRRLEALERRSKPVTEPVKEIWWIGPPTAADLSAGFQIAVRNWYEEELGWRSVQVRVDSRIYGETGEIIEISD
jgi:hypothetical protein